MIRLFALGCCLLFTVITMGETITVKNIDELKKANAAAKAGDIIVLKNGIWKDVSIELNCNGTKDDPITFKAEQAGKVQISGHSQLKLGGSYIVVEGLYFTEGYAGDAVIDFRIDKKQLANNCRVTNTVINDFNNPKRLDENYWVEFYGKNNRVDHCTFQNKKNMGVLMAIILDDDRSRENFHSIDHNYFGFRLPLASNSGEMIRIGVSQHCEFNSNTQVVDNYFEHCDGETEIISVKSCSNVVRNNVFKECQGGVVLRHGHYNVVENNLFLGNDKPGTGGVRIINRGQWVVNNLFYKCRGVGFRSPLSLMNGVPNSPAFRYVAVTEAVVMNNSFYNCTPFSLCEGSDTERTVVPSHVIFAKNIFYNDRDKVIYNKYDDISKISFSENVTGNPVTQSLAPGFTRMALTVSNAGNFKIPEARIEVADRIPDSLTALAKVKLAGHLSSAPGLSDEKAIKNIEANNKKNSGAKWFEEPTMHIMLEAVEINCADGKSLTEALSNPAANPTRIHLTGSNYQVDQPIIVAGNITITSAKKSVKISTPSGAGFNLLQVKAGSRLTITDTKFDLGGFHGSNFITADLTGSSNHSNLVITGNTFTNLNGTLFNAAKSTVFDSIIIKNNAFNSNTGTLFNFNNETDKKGYYSVEQLKITNNTFSGNKGQLLGMIRSGNDESTMGPLLLFKNNVVGNCSSEAPLISLYGTQLSTIEYNRFMASNTAGTLVQYEDAVRAVHSINNNSITKSGKIITNKFVTSKNNTIK
ncbi:polysaccharide lyase 6 family protein [Ferruginibacter sp.]